MHTAAAVLFGAAVLGAALLAMLAWRLSQGPLDVRFLTGRIEAALNTAGAPTHIRIGDIALAWEGFNRGLDRPVDLRVRDIAIIDAAGYKRLEVPSATVTVSLPALSSISPGAAITSPGIMVTSRRSVGAR